jgi:hypothetical protein
MLVARAVTSLQRTGINHSYSLPLLVLALALALTPLALNALAFLPALRSLARKILFSIWVDGVVLLPPRQVLRPRRGSICLQRFHSTSGWSSVAHWSLLVGSWGDCSKSKVLVRSQRFRFESGFRLALLQVLVLGV